MTKTQSVIKIIKKENTLLFGVRSMAAVLVESGLFRNGTDVATTYIEGQGLAKEMPSIRCK